MNTSCGDTVKCLLDAGKSPIFRSQSPCTYIYVQESQRFWDFVRIYTYERVNLSNKSDVQYLQAWQKLGTDVVRVHSNCNPILTTFDAGKCR